MANVHPGDDPKCNRCRKDLAGKSVVLGLCVDIASNLLISSGLHSLKKEGQRQCPYDSTCLQSTHTVTQSALRVPPRSDPWIPAGNLECHGHHPDDQPIHDRHHHRDECKDLLVVHLAPFPNSLKAGPEMF